MSILTTFPGRYGDLVWALPAIRALSRRVGEPVDLQVAGEFASIVPLLLQQPYLGHVWASVTWPLHPDHRESPANTYPPQRYDHVFHLGFRGWPQRPLPFEVLYQLNQENQDFLPFKAEELHLEEPWIHIDGPGAPCKVAVGFTEAWFELKLGLMVSLGRQRRDGSAFQQLTLPGTRWTHEVPPGPIVVQPGGWLHNARTIRNARLFFGDCSALHVLAAALGKRVVLCEPMEARWNPIFYPLGMDGPQVTVVKGNDGKPTFDARHCADALETALKEGALS